MIVMMLASINAMVGMIDWGGAILDSLFGKRVALTGSDWIRLVVSLGGAVLAIRLVAEVRRCRPALALMLVAWLMLSIPEAAKWNVLAVDSLSRWILVTSTPLLACTARFLSLGTYLRMLYREVRQISDGEPLMERVRQFQVRWFHRSQAEEDEQVDSPRVRGRTGAATTSGESAKETRRWWQRKQQRSARASVARESASGEEIKQTAAPSRDQPDTPSMQKDGSHRDRSSTQADASKPKAKSKRRWFGLRRAKPDNDGSDQDRESKSSKREASAAPAAEKRSRFSMRLKPTAAKTDTREDELPATQAAAARAAESKSPVAKAPVARAADGNTPNETESGGDASKKKSAGLTGWFRRGKSRSDESEKPSSRSNASSAKNASQANGGSSDEGDIEGENIDWDSLSKADRRRLRKQLKRQNRAA